MVFFEWFFLVFYGATCRICWYTQRLRAFLVFALFMFFHVFGLSFCMRFPYWPGSVFAGFAPARGPRESTLTLKNGALAVRKVRPTKNRFFLCKIGGGRKRCIFEEKGPQKEVICEVRERLCAVAVFRQIFMPFWGPLRKERQREESRGGGIKGGELNYKFKFQFKLI